MVNKDDDFLCHLVKLYVCHSNSLSLDDLGIYDVDNMGPYRCISNQRASIYPVPKIFTLLKFH